MLSYRWSHLIAVFCGVGGVFAGTSASAFQFPPLSDDLNTRYIHSPDAWVGGAFQSSGGINHSPAEFGPAPGMWQRSSDGSPASGDSFPTMTPGPLPGGLSPYGFNSSGMNPPINQPPYIANNPAFGGNGQAPFQSNQTPLGPNGQWAGNFSNGFGPNGSSNAQPLNGPFGANAFGPNGAYAPNPSGPNQPGQNPQSNWNPSGYPFGPPQMTGATRMQPKVSWAIDSAQQPYIGLMGQIARPGVYEIEKQGTRLADLIQEIGGLAREASGQFRIIRNGRPGQMTSYSGAAYFELMPGDLIIADAQSGATSNDSRRDTNTNTKSASAGAVQIGFVNLIDRPVVLKLRREHATVYEILALMRQDENLAAQVKVLTPPNQRMTGQSRPDTTLPSETVLIFPPNSVRAARLAPLPEPFPLKRKADSDGSTPSRETQPQDTLRGSISPDVTQSPRTQPPIGSWSDSTPLPQDARSSSQPRTERSQEVAEVPPPPAEETSSPKRAGGVRGTPRGAASTQDLIARDRNMVLAPPAEGSTDHQHSAPAPDPAEASSEPSLLKATGTHRPIRAVDEDETADAMLSAADLDEVVASNNQAGSRWSIWPPLLTAGIGLLVLIGFSLSLRRRTQQAANAIPSAPPTAVHRQPIAVNSPSSRSDELDALINDQLPLTEEKVPFVSPMQFHGRPQPPKTIRLDQEHALPKPHAPDIARSQITRQQTDDRQRRAVVPKVAAIATQKFHIDRTTAAGSGTQAVPAPSRPPQTVGPLDRALSAVQKQTTPKQTIQKREEHGA